MSDSFDFIVAQLKRTPKADFATVRDKAKAKGHVIYPISYGRAQAILGLVKSKPRGAAKAKLVQKLADDGVDLVVNPKVRVLKSRPINGDLASTLALAAPEDPDLDSRWAADPLDHIRDELKKLDAFRKAVRKLL